MKKVLTVLAIAAGMISSAAAQNKGRIETHDMGNFKVHVYYTNDALGDASYIVEGRRVSLPLSSLSSRRMWQSMMHS